MGFLASLVHDSRRISRLTLPDDDEIEENSANTFLPWLPEVPTKQMVDPLPFINIAGDQELQTMLKHRSLK